MAYSIPEDVRHLRDRLRDRLAWLGFGSLGNGLWISPHDVEQKVRALAEQLGIEQHLECFRAQRAGSHEPQALVDRCWDLPGVNAHYVEFTERWRAELDRCEVGISSGDLTAEECFTLRFDLIHEFRAFPLEDPYLPLALLPERWHGGAATQLFHALHDVLEGPADQYVDGLLAAAPSIPAAADG